MRNEENFEGIKYLKAKKRVEKIKGFYIHLIVYIVVNLFLSGIIIYGLMSDEGDSFEDVIIFINSSSNKKLKQIMEEEERKYKF